MEISLVRICKSIRVYCLGSSHQGCAGSLSDKSYRRISSADRGAVRYFTCCCDWSEYPPRHLVMDSLRSRWSWTSQHTFWSSYLVRAALEPTKTPSCCRERSRKTLCAGKTGIRLHFHFKVVYNKSPCPNRNHYASLWIESPRKLNSEK